MYLSLSRLFGFFQDINRVVRGVTHQFILKENDFSNMIGAKNFKVDVMHFSWILPVLHPSLFRATRDSFRSRINREGELIKSCIRKGQFI